MAYPEVAPHWELYEVHLDEAEYLDTQWENALTAPDRYLGHVAQREARLLAHVDALALGGGEVSQRYLRPALAVEEAPRVSAAALALLLQEGTAGRDAVLAALTDGPPQALPGLQRALELCGREDVLPALTALLTPDTDPAVSAVALEVHAAHGRVPSVALESWLVHPEPTVVAAACRVLPFMGTALPAPVLRQWTQALESSEPLVRDAALASGAVLGLRAAWTRCLQVVEAREPSGRLPLLLLAQGGNTQEHARLMELLDEPRSCVDAVWALGHGGRPEAVDACLRLLEDGHAGVARLATESFASITGFPLEDAHLLLDEEPPEDASPAAPLLLEVEKTLPRASPEAARAWWTRQREQRRFAPGMRYLAGVPFSATALVRSFATAPARRWSALALELSIRSRGRHIVSARDFSFRRHQRLATVQGFAPRGEQPFSSLLHS
ncbi:TIGR02270 family protein [Corallococcus sicarius]|nr:TIGR02270 family protein [Corallococcus sicarius]